MLQVIAAKQYTITRVKRISLIYATTVFIIISKSIDRNQIWITLQRLLMT